MKLHRFTLTAGLTHPNPTPCTLLLAAVPRRHALPTTVSRVRPDGKWEVSKEHSYLCPWKFSGCLWTCITYFGGPHPKRERDGGGFGKRDKDLACLTVAGATPVSYPPYPIPPSVLPTHNMIYTPPCSGFTAAELVAGHGSRLPMLSTLCGSTSIMGTTVHSAHHHLLIYGS